MNASPNLIQTIWFRFAVIAIALMVGFGAAEARSTTASSVSIIATTKKAPSRVIGSVYCVRGQVAIKGWERDLVRRNPGLNQFHWSPITAARPGVVVFRQPGGSSTLKQYHYSKPTVISMSEVRAAQETKKMQIMRAQAPSRRTTQAELNGRLRAGDEQVQSQLVSTYGNSFSQPGVYTYQSRYQSRVNGRLISTR